jgi:shikimate kinase
MNILLTGMMGSGKSTIGRLLSIKSGKSLIDLDELITHKTGPIKTIFKEFGEEYFRDLETEELKALTLSISNSIISTGGGVILREQNRGILRKLGKVIWLKVSPEKVAERLLNDKERPLLLLKESETLESKIRKLIESRTELYSECADLIIDTDNFNETEVTEIILNSNIWQD